MIPRIPTTGLFLLLFLLLFLFLSLPLSGLANAPKALMPQGVWRVALNVHQEDQQESFDGSGKKGPLIVHLIPDATLREAIGGEITRTIRRYTLDFTYGLSHSWSLLARLPYVMARQNASLVSITDNPSLAVQETLARLESQTIQGLGDVTLLSRHRPLYSDWNAFSWGYGLSIPGDAQKKPYVGSSTLQLGEPVRQLLGFLHYTRYPALSHSRFEAQARLERGLGGTVEVEGGGSAQLDALNAVSVQLDWTQELGAFSYGLGWEAFQRGEHLVDKERLGDSVRFQRYALRLGLGNLHQLEGNAPGWPWQLELRWRKVVLGAGIPTGNDLLLTLHSYF